MTETLAHWERALDAHLDGLGGERPAGDPWTALEALDPVEGARFALRFMLVDEVRSLGPHDFALADRKRAAHAVILRGLPGLSLEEITAALVSGALWVNWTVAWEHHRFTFLSEHPALAAPEARLHVLREAVALHGWSHALVPWFLHRLIEDPVPSAGDWLFESWRANRGDGRVEFLLAEAVIAAGHRAGMEAIAGTMNEESPSQGG